MKIKYLLLALTTFVFLNQGQSQVDFRSNFGLGYGLPMAEQYTGGIIIDGDAKVFVTDKIAVGLRGSAVFNTGNKDYLVQFDPNSPETGFAISFRIISGFSLIGEYYFGEGTTRPYAGLGIGRFSGGSISQGFVTSSQGTQVSQSAEAFRSVGLSPSFGIDLNRIRFEVVYNHLFSGTKATVTQQASGSGSASQSITIQDDYSNSYVAFKMAFLIGRKQ